MRDRLAGDAAGAAANRGPAGRRARDPGVRPAGRQPAVLRQWRGPPVGGGPGGARASFPIAL